MDGLISLENISLRPIERELLDLNAVSSNYGLTLSAEDAHSLSVMRNRSVKENERVEIGGGAVPQILKKFCTSRFVTQENYAYILEEVTYLFYYIKTETDDRISDGELIDELFNRFELECRGSIDTLEARESERIIRKVNSGENYRKWFADRDELDYTDAKGSREAPTEQVKEAYGENFFDGDSPSDHDKYEKDVGEGAQADVEGFDLDAFDEFFDRAAVLANSDEKKNNTAKRSDDGDDGEDENDG